MKRKKINMIVDLTKATTFIPKTYEEEETRYVEGKLYKNKCGRYEIDERHGLYDGSELELNLCGTWVKTRIELCGTSTYCAEGLKGLSLTGLTARVSV